MGAICPCNGTSDPQTRQFDRQLNSEKQRDFDTIKLLFLGAGGSGKSTLFKQMRILHGAGLGESERILYKKNVKANILEGLRVLASKFIQKEQKEENDDEDYDGSDDDDEPFDYEDEKGQEFTEEHLKIVEEHAKKIVAINAPGNWQLRDCEKLFTDFWNLDAVKALWKRRSNLQIQDSLEYFIGRIPEIVKDEDNYVPSKQDCLRVRARTTGIVEETFRINGRKFCIVDVGGQRSERKKWIKCFEDVTGIIFVVSLSGYDQYLFEDESIIRLQESLRVFADLNRQSVKIMEQASVIIFLNKKDLFEEKIKRVPLTTCFPNYKGENTYKAAVEHIKGKFLAKNHDQSRKIYVHETCATDTDQMSHIFESVNHNIINKALVKAGLLVGP